MKLFEWVMPHPCSSRVTLVVRSSREVCSFGWSWMVTQRCLCPVHRTSCYAWIHLMRTHSHFPSNGTSIVSIPCLHLLLLQHQQVEAVSDFLTQSSSFLHSSESYHLTSPLCCLIGLQERACRHYFPLYYWSSHCLQSPSFYYTNLSSGFILSNCLGFWAAFVSPEIMINYPFLKW